MSARHRALEDIFSLGGCLEMPRFCRAASIQMVSLHFVNPWVGHTNSSFHEFQVSKDGDSFPVPLAVAKMSELVKSMMDGTFRFPHDPVVFPSHGENVSRSSPQLLDCLQRMPRMMEEMSKFLCRMSRARFCKK